MTKPAEATLGDISLNRLAVCECSAMGHDDQEDHLIPTHVLICMCNYPLQARCPESIQRRQTGFVPLLMY